IGAGAIGAYKDCWFQSLGQGGFTAPQSASPFIGLGGQVSQTDESRLELIVPQSLLSQAALAISKYHPYEEPAFEFHPIETYKQNEGLGLIGHWEPKLNFWEKLHEIFPKQAGQASSIKWAGPDPLNIQKVALLPGSGGSYAALAHSEGAQVLITGDVSYHQALDAMALDLTLVDIGHYESEWPGVIHLKNVLGEKLRALSQDVDCIMLPQDCPWKYV
ncbi:MAG: Nif3-like dinuclear metal center hexameric protein, partial [Candidatus Adiutrix sp.]